MLRWLLRAMCVLVLGAGRLAYAQSDAWVIGPWTRASDAPVIAPLAKSVFDDPVSGKAVHWEALHTFNPAATRDWFAIQETCCWLVVRRSSR